MLPVDHTCKVLQIIPHEFSFLPTNKCAFGGFAFSLFDQKIYARTGGSGCLDSVKRRWITTLLQMSQDSLAYIVKVSALFFKKGAHKGNGVDPVCIFITDHQSQAFPRLKTCVEIFHV